MRLSDVLSRNPSPQFTQVDGFLIGKKCSAGQQIRLDIGQIALNFYCVNCEDFRTFLSKGAISCVCAGDSIISIDCILTYSDLPNVEAWFLVESDGEISGHAPRVRIIKRTVKLPSAVEWNNHDYGSCSLLLEKAARAYETGLGAGSLVYLRKAFEVATIQAATALELEYPQYEDGNPKNFFELLKRVDEREAIIPIEFSQDGYRLYRELSGVVHGNFDEAAGLAKFDPLYRLVVGILDNIKNKREFRCARAALGWCNDGGVLV